MGDWLLTLAASDSLPSVACDACGVWQRAWLENVGEALPALSGGGFYLVAGTPCDAEQWWTGLALRRAQREAGFFILLWESHFILLLESHGLVCHSVGWVTPL